MIPEFLRRFFTLNYHYEQAVDQQRARLLLVIINIVITLSFIWTAIITLPEILRGYIDITVPIVFLVSILLWRWIQHGRATIASYVFLFLIFVSTVLPQLNDIDSPWVIILMIPIVLSSILVDRRILAGMTVSILVLILRSGLNSAGALAFIDIFGISLVIALVAIILGLFTKSLSNITETAARLITKALGLTQNQSDVSDATVEEIIANSINHLRKNLGFSYIRVLLLDDNQQIINTYYSSIGVEQVAQTTTFSFTENSAFQHALDALSSQIVRPTDIENLSAHLLPASTAGVIMPAHSMGRSIALYDIQTESNQLIESEDVAILTLFIAQITARLIYRQTVTTLQDDIREQQALIDQQRQQLLRIQNMQTEGIQTDWENYLHQRGISAIGYDIDSTRQLSELHVGNIPDSIQEAMETGDVVVRKQDNHQLVTIPIRLRDSILGAMSFTVPNKIPITDRKVDFIRSVTERLALALDNKRLIEQTQTQAQRESTANEIGSMLLRSTDVETVLQTAAERFNEALGAIATQIYLQPTALQSIERPQREDTV